MKKICFITYHNWETKRHGGFHQFAQAAVERGFETVFFSFARPYYIKWKHEERLNKAVLKELSKGKEYEVGSGKIMNVTFPTLGLPGPIRKYFPYWLNKWLLIHSLKSFNSFCKQWLLDTDCFVFESCEAVLLAETIKRKFPEARIIYRPSDPLWEFSNHFFNVKGEKRMLEIADRIITVNPESIDGYKQKFSDSFIPEKYICIPNGVSLKDYEKSYPSPEVLKDCISATYIGAFLPDWSIVAKAAEVFPDVRFVIITPHKLEEKIQKVLESFNNIFYIPGIHPSEVPMWVTNSSIILQPFPKEYGHLDKVSLGLTAQNYKAMAAKKTIVTHGIPIHLSKYGLITSDTEHGFIEGIRNALKIKENPYKNFDLNSRDWKNLCEEFIKECEA